ncbi:hypothetical protein WJX72_010063 [[Myrmecia] bisecta]|uniref:tRNA (guanine-N(7)-)-methyltransferase n=1 Tax=[Myrmecia] bisecta TaxID=41462 RepID=A0AAW1R9W4_9CHLO
MPWTGKDTRVPGVQGRQLAQGKSHPRKRLYRSRAHSNPLNDSHFPVPAHPQDFDWATYYPAFFGGASASHDEAAPSTSAGAATASTSAAAPADAAAPPAGSAEQPLVRFADVGCGFGGLLIRLSPLYPDTLMVGMELRDRVTEYVKERIAALRREEPGKYDNVSCIRTNAQKYLPNYFAKGQLQKLFFLFPDPHFKKANHRRRIINTTLLDEYAYILAVGGIIYTITDVQELGDWMRDKLESHPLFERISDDELAADPAANLLETATEEGQKVARNGGKTWRSVYRRIAST